VSAFEKFFNARSVYRIVKSLEWDDEKLYKDGTFEHYWWMRAETYLAMHRESRWDGWRTFLEAAPAGLRGDMNTVFRECLELFAKNATQLLGLWEETFASLRLRPRGRVNPWTGSGGTTMSAEQNLEENGRIAGLQLQSVATSIKERMDRYG
jgi:hypothetical protein